MNWRDGEGVRLRLEVCSIAFIILGPPPISFRDELKGGGQEDRSVHDSIAFKYGVLRAALFTFHHPPHRLYHHVNLMTSLHKVYPNSISPFVGWTLIGLYVSVTCLGQCLMIKNPLLLVRARIYGIVYISPCLHLREPAWFFLGKLVKPFCLWLCLGFNRSNHVSVWGSSKRLFRDNR